MKEEKIQENIKQLQNDISYSFKQTSEVIDIIYRKAVNDVNSEKSNTAVLEVKDAHQNDIIIQSSKDLNKQFGSKVNDADINIEQKINRAKRDSYYDILKYVESNKHDLIDVYNYIKEKCKEFGEDGVKNKPRSRKRQNPYF